MIDAADACRNHLLASFSDVERQRLLPRLERVELRAGQSLHDAGASWRHVYFPTTAAVSLLYLSRDGAALEIAQVGREGMVGVSLLLGGRSTTTSAEVVRAGECLRLPAAALQAEFDLAGPAMHLMLRYTQALIAQIAQNAVRNRHHALEQQLSRWLLLSLDRLQGNELLATQESIAARLGVRREGVTDAALHLQAAGLIRYARGRIQVLDRHGLERRSCECYRVICREYERLLPTAATATATAPVAAQRREPRDLREAVAAG